MILWSLATGIVSAQKISQDKVPVTVLNNFKKQFTNPGKVQWEMDQTDFEVNFKLASVEYSAKYDAQGKWLETEQEIKKSEVPALVMKTVDAEFPKAEIEESEKVTYPDKKTVYEMEIEKNKQKFEIQLSEEGKLLKKEEITKKGK